MPQLRTHARDQSNQAALAIYPLPSPSLPKLFASALGHRNFGRQECSHAESFVTLERGKGIRYAFEDEVKGEVDGDIDVSDGFDAALGVCEVEKSEAGEGNNGKVGCVNVPE